MSKTVVLPCACVILGLLALRSGHAQSQQAPYSNVPSDRQGNIEDCHSKTLPKEADTSKAMLEGWIHFCEQWQALVKEKVITPMEAQWGNLSVSDSVSSNGVLSYDQQQIRFFYDRQFRLYRNHRIWRGTGSANVLPVKYRTKYYQQFVNDMSAKEGLLDGLVPDFPTGSRMPWINWRWRFEFP
jgi:hypothetical protein